MTDPGPGRTIVTLAARPDLAEVVADWLSAEFGSAGLEGREESLAMVREALRHGDLPQLYVLLQDGQPVGTATLDTSDLPERPDLTPWLASVFVLPAVRGSGVASALVREVEAQAGQRGVGTLWLYTWAAEGVYAGLGWQVAERFERRGQPNVLMSKRLGPDAV